MSKYAQVIMGAAGSGKSSYCYIMQNHCRTVGRTIHVINLDPAADEFRYEALIDIRDLITLEDVMEEMDLGPNGGLVFCMEYIVENINWLEEQLGEYTEDYILFDCPGQIELYSHLPIMKNLIKHLLKWNYNTCGVYLQDASALSDPSRYIASTLSCLSAMIQLELPQINIMSKCDLLRVDDNILDEISNPDPMILLEQLNATTTKKHHRLNQAFCDLLNDYSLVGFIPLNATDSSSISYVLNHVDHAIQWGEDEDIKIPKDELDNDEK